MNPIIIAPRNKSESRFLADLLKKLNVTAKTITDEEMEDLGLLVLMKQANRSQKVSRETIMKKLYS